MVPRVVTALLLLCMLQSALARTVKRTVSSDTAASWTVSINKGRTRKCAGAQLNNEWFITLKKCIKKNSFSKYSVVFNNGEERSITEVQQGKMFMLIKTAVSSTVSTTFASLATHTIPSSYDGTFRYYGWDSTDAITSNNVNLATDADCSGVSNYKNGFYQCFAGTATADCPLIPGVPIFGYDGTTWLLIGLSSDETSVCDGSFRKAAKIWTYTRWISNRVADCGSPSSINQGSVVLDSFSTSVGATATVTCNPGFDSSRQSVTCAPSGRWQNVKCNKKDCGALPSIADGSYNLKGKVSTYGAKAAVNCNVGYGADKRLITCQSSGTWETATCTLQDCGSPSIADGSVVLDSTTTTYGSTASVTCNEGYDLNKASITCQATGVWEEATCTLKDCGPKPRISNGNVKLDQFRATRFGATATVTCNSGYEPDSPSISCLSSGQWQTVTCSKKDCGALPSLAGGSYTLDSQTTDYESTATVTCNTGYNAPDKSVISCRKTGTWETATCTIKDCGSLPSVADGTLSLDSTSTTYGSTASLICNSGDTATITCESTGVWETPTCTFKDCGSPPSIADGSVSLISSTTTYGSTASVTCDQGYEGDTTITCKIAGDWSTATCTIKDCGSLPSISDGSVSLDSTTTTYGSTASVTCNSGYSGDRASIACQSTGVWETATCTIKDCGAPPSIAGGSVSLDSSTSTIGSTATVTCNSGYDGGSTTITCQSTGVWETATCTIKDCGSLPSISDGSVSLDSTTTTYGSTASVTCNSGYSGDRASISCQLTGVWETATCTIKDCGSLPSISDGTVSLDSTTTTYGSTASVTCNSGYSGDRASIACQSTGVWETATCTIKDCGSLPSISDGTVSLDSTTTTYGSTASVTCNSGYSGDRASISCQLTGVWETATCTIKDCGSLPSISDGTVSLDSTTTTYGSTASVTCNSGYSGDRASIACQSTGVWETATCTIKDCGSLPSISDGSVSLDSTTTTYGSTASVTCNSGYSGDRASIACQSTGVWETATCTIKDCGAPPSIAGGSVSLDSSTTITGSTATVTCNSGYDGGSATITCQSTGVWETTTCTIKDCGSLPSIADGSLSLDSTTTTYGSTGTVTCSSGYMSDSASISCLSTGVWEIPSCYKVGCPTTSWKLDSNRCYYFSNGARSWSSAEAWCVGWGAHLVKVSSSTEDNYVRGNLVSNTGYWLGLSDTNNEGTFVWVSDNSEAVFTAWNTNNANNPEPNGGTSENCVEYSEQVVDWNDVSCSVSRRFVCETTPLKDCGALPSIADGSLSLDSSRTTYGSTATVTCNNGYMSDSASISCQSTGVWESASCYEVSCPATSTSWKIDGSQCYYFSNGERTWSSAESWCVSYGAHLVKVSSSAEDNFVRGYLDANTGYWLGLSDTNNEGTFVWVSDNSEAVFTAWNTNNANNPEPNGGTSENCVEYSQQVVDWNDVSCTVSRKFVCEKTGQKA